jgi:hypothetical protein
MFSYILKHDDDFSVFRMKQKLKLKVKISTFLVEPISAVKLNVQKELKLVTPRK